MESTVGQRDMDAVQTALLHQCHDAIIVTDACGTITAWNQGAEELYGWTQAEALGRPIPELVPAAGRIPPAGDRWDGELAHTTRDGRQIVVESRRVTALSSSGALTGTLQIDRDITARKHPANAEAIGRLAAGIAHHFNNLMAIVMGNASLALEECASCDAMESMIAAARRGAELTEQLMLYAGRAHLRSTPISLADLLGNVLSASMGRQMRLDWTLAPDLPEVDGDPNRLRQLIMVLVSNAVEAIPRDSAGTVTVTAATCLVTPETAASHGAPPGPYVCLTVRDTGSGMDEATKARLFEPFFTRKFTGRGLGLAAAQGIVRAHHGFIEVDSAPGAGSTFRVFLPARAADAPAPQPSAAPRTILLVDREEMVRRMLAAILKRHEYAVLQAADATQALQVLAESPAMPATVLLDILTLPVNGLRDVLLNMQARYPGIKVIVTSSCPAEHILPEMRGSLIAGYLRKPFTGDGLLERLRHIEATDQGVH